MAATQMTFARDSQSIHAQYEPAIMDREDTGTPNFNSSLLLRLAEIRMHHIDGALTRLTGSIDRSARESQTLNELLGKSTRYAQGDLKDANFDAFKNEFLTAAENVPSDSPVKQTLLDLANGPIMNSDGNRIIGKDEIRQLFDEVKRTLDGVDKNSQTASLNIQAKMGERSELLTATSQLIASLQEVLKAIANNVGRG